MNKGLKVVKRLLFSSREQDGVRRADVRGQWNPILPAQFVAVSVRYFSSS